VTPSCSRLSPEALKGRIEDCGLEDRDHGGRGVAGGKKEKSR